MKYNLFSKIYTDGSKQNNICGIGIYFPEDDIEMGAKLQNEVSIKTAEIIAIIEAINFLIVNNHKNILVLTDSLSTCESLKYSIKTKNKKFFENIIINTALHNKDCNIVIMWIPAHIGIMGNEKADQIAKNMTSSTQHMLIENLIPIEDANKLIKKEINNMWNAEYNELSRIKGKINREINRDNLPNCRWFQKIKKIKNSDIKIINRLRTNHSYNKEYKYMIKLEDNPNCDLCNERENNEHIIMKCRKYNDIRVKYPCLNNNNISLIEILKTNNPEQIKCILQFIHESKINI